MAPYDARDSTRKYMWPARLMTEQERQDRGIKVPPVSDDTISPCSPPSYLFTFVLIDMYDLICMLCLQYEVTVVLLCLSHHVIMDVKIDQCRRVTKGDLLQMMQIWRVGGDDTVSYIVVVIGRHACHTKEFMLALFFLLLVLAFFRITTLAS